MFYRPKGTIVDPDLTDFIIKAWNVDEISYSRIAKIVLEKFGVKMSASAVGGRLTRAEKRGMKIRRPGGIIGARIEAKAKAAAQPKDTAQRGSRAHRDRSLLGSLPPLPAAAPDLSCKLTLEEVQAISGCRWPAGHTPNMRFCGKRRDPNHESYCPSHYKKAIAEFQPVWEIKP